MEFIKCEMECNTLANLIPYLYTPVAEIILLRLQNKKCFEFKSAFIALLAILYSLWAIYGAGTEVLSYGALLVFLSIPVYLFVQQRRRT